MRKTWHDSVIGISNNCCLFPWSSSRPFNVLECDGEDAVEALDELSKCMKTALELSPKSDDEYPSLSHEFASALLEEPSYEQRSSGLNHVKEQENETGTGNDGMLHEHFRVEDLAEKNDDGTLTLKGIPHRPYYKEISRRIFVLHRHYNNASKAMTSKYSSNPSIQVPLPSPLIDAQLLGLKENDRTKQPSIYMLPHDEISVTNCEAWLHHLGEDGIRILLGLRSTIGTHRDCFPPDHHTLIQAATVPYKPETKPPHLTVASRARAKHAHRGEDQFFGICNGSTQFKNDAAEVIVKKLIHDAVWINIHEFGGVDNPVIEIRNRLGYGARWEADWNLKGSLERPTGATFRGFLEPHMEDGFERRWRH
jgi:hypothetical protein